MNATIYRDAAEEHVTTAALLQDNAAYVGAYYFAGLAVECLLRAYRYRIDPVFDARHDLYELAKVSNFFGGLGEEDSERGRALLGEVIVRWTNTHRYRSLKVLRSFVIKAGLHHLSGSQTVRGDVVAHNGRILVASAKQLVEMGVRKWES